LAVLALWQCLQLVQQLFVLKELNCGRSARKLALQYLALAQCQSRQSSLPSNSSALFIGELAGEPHPGEVTMSKTSLSWNSFRKRSPHLAFKRVAFIKLLIRLRFCFLLGWLMLWFIIWNFGS